MFQVPSSPKSIIETTVMTLIQIISLTRLVAICVHEVLGLHLDEYTSTSLNLWFRFQLPSSPKSIIDRDDSFHDHRPQPQWAPRQPAPVLPQA